MQNFFVMTTDVIFHTPREGAAYIIIHNTQVDTEICEQLFSWMSRYYRITQHMNWAHFLFYLLFLCDAHNWL